MFGISVLQLVCSHRQKYVVNIDLLHKIRRSILTGVLYEKTNVREMSASIHHFQRKFNVKINVGIRAFNKLLLQHALSTESTAKLAGKTS